MLRYMENPKHIALISFWLGIASKILMFTGLGALIALITSIIGIVLGKKGLKTSENKKAKVGIILNGIVCGLWIVLVMVAIVWTIIG